MCAAVCNEWPPRPVPRERQTGRPCVLVLGCLRKRLQGARHGARSMRLFRRSVHSDAWPSLLEAAQKRDCPETMYRVGMAYFRGGDDGAPSKDATAAKDYLQAAAELGHPRAQAALGNIYYDEMEALRSLAQAHDYQAAAAAHKWLSRASEQGELSATRTLVPLYITKGRLDLALRTFAVRVRQSLW